jgi:hypothetical protein
MARAKLYTDPTERQRINKAAARLLASPLRSIQVRRGEADAKLIVRWFALHGRPEQVEAEEVGGKWIVRIVK